MRIILAFTIYRKSQNVSYEVRGAVNNLRRIRDEKEYFVRFENYWLVL